MNKNTCKHYIDPHHNTHCRAGVCFNDVTTGKESEPGNAFRRPCIDWEAWHKEGQTGSHNMSTSQKIEFARRGRCDKREVPTSEEIKLEEEKWAKHMEKVMLVTNLLTRKLRKELRGKGAVLDCPACKGKLHVYVSSYNGHAKVVCETDGCVRWQE